MLDQLFGALLNLKKKCVDLDHHFGKKVYFDLFVAQTLELNLHHLLWILPLEGGCSLLPRSLQHLEMFYHQFGTISSSKISE